MQVLYFSETKQTKYNQNANTIAKRAQNTHLNLKDTIVTDWKSPKLTENNAIFEKSNKNIAAIKSLLVRYQF